jgi:hypothetical protein
MLQRLYRLFSTTIDYREFILHLAITALLCFLVGILYVVVAPRPQKALRLARIFPVLGLTMALAVTVLGSSLAIAIGLVGAVSVVRYRAVINDLEQLSFILLTVATGLACGSAHLLLVVAALPLIGGLLLLRHYVLRKRSRLQVLLHGSPAQVQAMLPGLREEFPGLRLRHAHLQNESAEWRFSLLKARPGDLLALYDRLAQTPGLRISLREDTDE